MSTSARRLAPDVATTRFSWQADTAPARPQLVPVAFERLSPSTQATIDSNHDVEARELHLPSVAQERLEAIEREAYTEGFMRGQRTGEQEQERQLAAAAKQIAQTVDELTGMRVTVMRRSDRELVHLALAMAERIVRRELKSDPELLLVMARVAIERLGDRAAAVVHLHPADYDAVTKLTPARGGAFELVADPSIARGGCLIRSAFGSIDASVDAQIRELSRELLGNDEEATDGPVAGL